MRRCTKCGKNQPEVYFNSDRTRPDGKYSQCKDCTRENCRRVYNQSHEARIAANRKWKAENADRHREINRDWRRNNPEAVRENTAAYRRRVKQATPPWVDRDEIKAIYSDCPKGWHVDHIHPLVGENFCGLNVPWNLQHLPADVHRRKGNKLPVEAGGHSHL